MKNNQIGRGSAENFEIKSETKTNNRGRSLSKLDINEKCKSKNIFKTYFLIINLVLAIAAFSYLIGAEESFSPLPINAKGNPFIPKEGDILVTDPTTGVPTLAPESASLAKTPLGEVKAMFTNVAFKTLVWVAVGAGVGALIGILAGGKNGGSWGALSGAAGAGSGYLLTSLLIQNQMNAGTAFWWGTGFGLSVGLAIFLLTYKKESKKIVEFNCRPFEAPIGGNDCELCNSFKECSEYTCKSLGQACDIVNAGTKEQKCIWKNPRDVNSPIIFMTNVSKGLKYFPDKNLRPDKTGVEISKLDGSCIKAFTPLEFSISTKDSLTSIGEPSQCKIDYNLTTKFEEMSYYMGGSNLFLYNHTEKLALPGPDNINKIAPELKNDGTYTLYIRCQDANGNFNVDPYSVRFCVEKGPDTTPPIIENTSILNGYPIQFNKSSLITEVYLNEPAECKLSKTDTDYKNMENSMNCDMNLWEMNINNFYTCRANLTGIESRKENIFYFRCKDKPDFEEKDRNVNTDSYKYVVIGTQPLNIIESSPKDTIKGATDVVPVILTIKTDNGYKNGEAKCYYKTSNMTSYIQFLETGTNEHNQRQDLTTGSYIYSFKCVDLGGNTAYNSTSFIVETDKSGPVVTNVYKEIGQLKLKTNEEAECSYSNRDCNFEIADGVKMTTTNFNIHNAEWKININYYIRCKDKYNNQPNPNTCSIIVNPSVFAEGVTSSG